MSALTSKQNVSQMSHEAEGSQMERLLCLKIQISFTSQRKDYIHTPDIKD